MLLYTCNWIEVNKILFTLNYMQNHFKNEILKVYLNDYMPVLVEWLGLQVARYLQQYVLS